MPAAAATAPSWTLRERFAAVFFVFYLTWQVAVPAWKLTRPERPGRFGWQMFAGTAVKVRFVLIARNGQERVVDPIRFQVARRLDLRLDDAFPPYLCAHEPAARAVRVELPGAPPREVPCAR